MENNANRIYVHKGTTFPGFPSACPPLRRDPGPLYALLSITKREQDVASSISNYLQNNYYGTHQTVESHQKFVSLPPPQTSTTTPTSFCMFTILILNSHTTFNCNC
jgi:hypothetical protein